MKAGMMNLVYDINRLVQFERCVAAPGQPGIRRAMCVKSGPKP